MARLLILACSQRKRLVPTLLPALDRYDGPAFRVVRRYLLTDPADRPDIYILSARFGLIGSDDPIPEYDQRMTPERMRELAPALVERLQMILDGRPYSQVLLSLGRSYLPAFME